VPLSVAIGGQQRRLDRLEQLVHRQSAVDFDGV
jgi:hypothetical protein